MIKFSVINTERLAANNVVTVLHWTAMRKEGKHTASAYGFIGLPAKDPSDPTFVAYADITEAQAIEWTKEVMGEEAVAALEAGLDAQIEAQRNPTQASGTPWAVSQPAE